MNKLSLRRAYHTCFSSRFSTSIRKKENYYEVFKSILSSVVDNNSRTSDKKIPKGAAEDNDTRDLKRKLGKSDIARLLQIVRLEARTLTYATGTLAVTTGISLVFPAAIGHVLDLAVTSEPVISQGMLSGGLFGLFMLQSSLIVVRSTLLNLAGERLSSGIRRDLVRHPYVLHHTYRTHQPHIH